MGFLTEAMGGSGVPVTVLHPHMRDLGGFTVRRILPAAQARAVGPFVFVDHMGPVTLAAGDGFDVRPHPHIGLATITYLTEGGFLHRDSLGSEQMIRTGEVNWMIAGSGIVHSERSDAASRGVARRMEGLQTWLALPLEEEERPASFHHHGQADLPLLTDGGISLRVVAGEAYGARAPVPVLSPTLYADAVLADGALLPLPDGHEARAAYILAGEVEIGGVRYPAGQMLIFAPQDRVSLRSVGPARVMLLGGAQLEGPRFLWWNFVSSRRERIVQAQEDYASGRFGTIPGDSVEFIPLPPA